VKVNTTETGEPIKKQFLKFFHRAGQEAALNVQGSLQEGSGR
jgi:hypothetical protein